MDEWSWNLQLNSIIGSPAIQRPRSLCCDKDLSSMEGMHCFVTLLWAMVEREVHTGPTPHVLSECQPQTYHSRSWKYLGHHMWTKESNLKI